MSQSKWLVAGKGRRHLVFILISPNNCSFLVIAKFQFKARQDLWQRYLSDQWQGKPTEMQSLKLQILGDRVDNVEDIVLL